MGDVVVQKMHRVLQARVWSGQSAEIGLQTLDRHRRRRVRPGDRLRPFIKIRWRHIVGLSVAEVSLRPGIAIDVERLGGARHQQGQGEDEGVAWEHGREGRDLR